jgi:HSP20 family protein
MIDLIIFTRISNKKVRRYRVMAAEKGKKEVAVASRQPFRDVEQMRKNFEDVFGRSLFPSAWGAFPAMEATMWAPAINVEEKPDKFVVKAEIPGVQDKDINISIAGDTLTIEGEKQTETESKKKGYYYNEISYGSFSRSLTIPSTVDINKIEAHRNDGVLEIDLPKVKGAYSKKIAVTAKAKSKNGSKK